MIALFLLKLSAGITLMWLLMPRSEVTDGFFRIQMRLLLGIAVLSALLLSRTTTWTSPLDKASSTDLPAAAGTYSASAAETAESAGTPVSGVLPDSAARTAGWLWRLQLAAACIAYSGSIFWALGRRLPGRVAIYLLVILCVGSLLLHSLLIPQRGGVLLQVLADVSSAAVLGATLTGMLMGHWYLTTPTMSIQPLSWFTKALLAAAGLRLLASGWALGQFGFSAADTTSWLWLTMRLCGGILAPLAVSLLTASILRHRNTQSATGVLFAGLILVFMGEMTAALLERDVRIPY